ncbi:MAG: hypothetical protein PVF45_14770 [Anaerolineae bacterium]|jgi:hypothetical protein
MDNIVAETIATLVGIFVGTLAALLMDRRNEQRRLRQRARTVLRSLAQELSENYKTIKDAKPAYVSTPWGKSFYVSTVAWETALSSGDLPDIIGFELTDAISAQYALLTRIRYYVNLLTQLWFAPNDVAGYEKMQQGFNRAIVEAMSQAISQHTALVGQIEKTMR